ncbi:acyl carrier protein [Paenibacillus athensensis]|uniref:Carrier domain-containing protein n=1 Tax=Paenibacillus athensensis TaxID=1967502 RepID=A0A4Y8Q8M7_9BACL|nr:phosphopantetheine-binding protein [Paenibacillus athensensis]MCD1257284.1 acyl carrier protein [Paenibacillus athensensis]
MLDEQFAAVLRRHLKYLKPTQELKGSDDLKALGLDSMASIDLLLDLEEALGIMLPDTMLTENTFSTADALWALLSEMTSQTA